MATDNSKGTAKPKRKPRGKPFKPNNSQTGEQDERINRVGAPLRGESYKEIYDQYDNMTADKIAALLPPGELKSAYMKMPKGIAMKHLKVIRINAALMFDPTPGLLKETSERTDGKVADKIEHEGSLKIEGLAETLKKVYGNRDTNRK